MWEHFSNSLSIEPAQTVAWQAIKNVPNIVSLSHCWEQLYSYIFKSYVKTYMSWYLVEMHVKVHGFKTFFVCFLWAVVCFLWAVCWCVHDDWQLCLVRVNSLITHLQLKKMSVMYESVHVAITWNERVFLGKISVILLICIMKKTIWKLCVNRIISVTGTRVNVYQIS